MKLFLVSGWATTKSIWDGVLDTLLEDIECETVDWWDAMDGGLEKRIERENRPSVLAGWSMGGQIVLNVASSSVGRIAGLFLVSPFTCLVEDFDRPGVTRVVHRQITSNLGRNRRAYLRAFFGDCIHPAKHPLTVGNLLMDSDSISLRKLRSGLEYMGSNEASVSSSIPAMVVHGREDRIIPWECSRYIADRLSDCLSEVYFENGGHILPVMEACKVGNLLNEFCIHCSA